MMPRKRQIIQLTEQDYRSLTNILSKGKSTARVQTRGRVLDLLHRGEQPERIGEILQVGIGTVYNLQRRYLKEGLESALTEKPRSGKPPVITGEMKAHITALSCSDAPTGHARRTLRLLADKAVEFGLVDAISYKTCGEILKKTN
jgi:putative transposase